MANRSYIVAGLLVIGIVGAGVIYATRPDVNCSATTVAGGAIGGPFELVDANGATVTSEQVILEPTLIYFGYTFCPDVCPIDNARNAAAIDILAEGGHSVTPAFVTVDPARDTIDVVADYVANFHPKMIGLTGSADQVADAAAAYRVFYRAHDDDPDYYLVDHSVFTYLVLPESGFAEFFRREDTPQQVADRVSCILGQVS